MKRADIEKAKEDEKLRRQRSASGPVRELYNGPASELATLHHAAGNHAIGQLVQAKLNIIQPSDPLEREADQVADQILRMKKPLTPISDSKEGRGVDTPKQVRKKAGSVNATTDSSVSNNFLRDLGPGRPLDTQVRAFMEPRFGQDLSQVRIHNDNNADKKTSAINAKAFTVGRDIVFGQNQYQLHTYEGKHLLSHELVHTIQGGNQIHRSPGPPSKRRPWTKAQLKYWLDQDLREAAKSHRSAVETMFSTSHFKTALWQVQSEEAKGKYRLGMAVLRMINAGVTDVPTSSPAYLAIRNPDNLEPRDLLNQVYRTAQGEVRRLIKEALASPPGKEAVERESSERARREKGYKYIFTDKPNKQDEKFANERERAILEDTAPIVEPPTEIPEEKDVEQNSGAKRRLNARPWFLLVDEKNRAGSVSISVYSRTPLVRNDRGIEDVTEIAFRLENPIIYGQSISIPPIINTGRLGCMNAVPFLVEYELGLLPVVSNERIQISAARTGADAASHYWLSGVEIFGMVDFTIYIANDLDTHVCGVGLNHDLLLEQAYNEAQETKEDMLSFFQEMRKDLALTIGVGQSMAIPITGSEREGKHRFTEIMYANLLSVCKKYQSGFEEFEPEVVEVP